MKIGVLGNFGSDSNMANGQTIKTQNFVTGIKTYTHHEILKINSSNWIKRPLALARSIAHRFQECDAVVMLPAQNGVRVFGPLLLHYKKKTGKKIFYNVIGGWLPEFLKDKKILKGVLRQFDGIWVETSSMQKNLERLGFANAVSIPNFKNLEPLTEQELTYPIGEPYQLCTFSRVMKEKGIEDAVNAVRMANETMGRTAYTLDIYGQVDAQQTQWFEALKASFPKEIRYCGCAEASQSVAVLRDYFALLFPTYYVGEGFAGTLIDAFFAGVPVIASDWRYNREIITEDTGMLFTPRDVDGLAAILIDIAGAPEKMLARRKHCLTAAEHYSAKTVMAEICGQLRK